MRNKNVAFRIGLKDNTGYYPGQRTVKDNKINRFLEIFKEKSFQRGSFTLASGLESDYYCDAKLTTMDPEGAHLLAELILDRVEELGANCIGGLVVGATPIIGSVVKGAFERGMSNLKGFYVRREQKPHGMERLIEGNVSRDDKVLIIDDVITTGSSVLKAINAVKEKGCKNILGVLCILDRNEGERDPELLNYKVESLLKKSDLFD